MRTMKRMVTAIALTGWLLAGNADAQVELSLNTWSIAAIDPDTGDVGVALASCVPEANIDAVAALVPGSGVAVTQAAFNIDNRNRVYAALTEGLGAQEIVGLVADPAVDARVGERQYGIVTLHDGAVEIAGFTGADTTAWAGIRKRIASAVTVQGNILVGEAVVEDALAAFLEDDPSGRNFLADRLMRALEAGSAAGGDRRCNDGDIDTTAATAFILLARGGDEPYATSNIMLTDQGTDRAPWLAISEANALSGPNPLFELRRRYDRWRERNLP